MLAYINADVFCISAGALPVHVNTFPPVDAHTEDQFSAVLFEAGRIVSRMKTEGSTITTLLNRLKQYLSDLERDDIRVRLKQEVSIALLAGGMPARMIETTTMVFVDLLMEGSDLVGVERGQSIVLYLKCGSVLILLSLRRMVRSGVLLRLLGDVIKQFIERRPRVQLIVKTRDYNWCLSYLRIEYGQFVSFSVCLL